MRVLSALVAALAMAASVAASAATFEVLSAGAVEPGLLPAAEAFRRQTGHEARIRFATAPALRQRVGGGEAVDVVIAPPAVLDDLAKTGRVDGAARVVVGKVGVGVAVRDGAPQPDVRTPEALKRAILGAESVIYNRASTGLYLETLFQRLGIAQEIAARSTRYPDGASVMEHLIKGSGREIGFGAITEIRPLPRQGPEAHGAAAAAAAELHHLCGVARVGLGARRAGEELRPVPRQPGRASDLRGKRHRIAPSRAARGSIRDEAARPAQPRPGPPDRARRAGLRRAAPDRQIDARHLRRVIDRMGLLQIDSVNVLVRAHYLPVSPASVPYPRRARRGCLGRRRPSCSNTGGTGFADPARLQPAALADGAATAAKDWRAAAAGASGPGFVEEVREQLAPVVRSGPRDRRGRRPARLDVGLADGKSALEYLFAVGERRRPTGRLRARYDLTERVLPPGDPSRRRPRRGRTRSASWSRVAPRPTASAREDLATTSG